jgi:SagB-type dehydrogenase family enzyme
LEIYWLEKDGLFLYLPGDHSLEVLGTRDLRTSLCKAALEQEMILQAPATMVFTAVFQRTQGKYGTDRGYRYVLIDLGHAAQNVLLQATALGLGAVPLGAFNDHSVQRLLDLPPAHAPLYLIPIGYPS